MTRDAFIQKWLDSKKPYNDENRMAMLDDLDKVIARGMTTDNTRLAALEAEGWKWWIVPAIDMDNDIANAWWEYLVYNPTTKEVFIADNEVATKAEAEAACLEYLLNLNTTAK